MKHESITREELFIKKCARVSNRSLARQAVELQLHKCVRLSPMFVGKEAAVPGLNAYYNRYLTASLLNDAYNHYRVMANRVSEMKNAEGLLPALKSAYNRYYQVKAGFASRGAVSEERKVSFNQMADVFEASIGAVYLAYGLESCYEYLNRAGIIKLSKIKQPIKTESRLIDELYVQYRMAEIEAGILRYTFANKMHLLIALLHSSSLDRYCADIAGYREYGVLGETVVKVLVVTYLFAKYPSAVPGMLTKLKIAGCSKSLLALIAIRSRLCDHIICDSTQLLKDILQAQKQDLASKGSLELMDGACAKELATLVEEIVGAIYIDAGQDIGKVRRVLMPLLEPYLDYYATPEYCDTHKQPKVALVELLSSHGLNYAEEIRIEVGMKSDGSKFVYQGYFKEILVEQAEASSNSKITKAKFIKLLYKKVKAIFKEYEEQATPLLTLKEIAKDSEAKGTKSIN